MPVPVSAMELLKSQAGRFIVAVVFLLGIGLKMSCLGISSFVSSSQVGSLG